MRQFQFSILDRSNPSLIFRYLLDFRHPFVDHLQKPLFLVWFIWLRLSSFSDKNKVQANWWSIGIMYVWFPYVRDAEFIYLDVAESKINPCSKKLRWIDTYIFPSTPKKIHVHHAAVRLLFKKNSNYVRQTFKQRAEIVPVILFPRRTWIPLI